ncbi:uncharacterized protein LOC129001444 [Macrosteles quadrilineatus]|uniref:uncharacterized protein LOC129001444 n=1 Tax=Macrosteles quadrilineatus TaxID=74068 RepID=UPI0023E15212|nr:uncharacterized protein LOC129001444 [Macrosteles quadrilineatus]
MYRCIQVHPDDQKYQLILWRDPKTQEISTYKLTTVTYGLSSSPFHAIRTLHQLADDEGGSFPAAAKVLRDNTYVDDIICGAHTLNEAKQLRDQLIELLARGGFELRKWTSNCPEILQDLPQDHLETPVFLEATNHPHFAILGLHWSPISDCFTYNLSLPDGPPTKRSVLSIIARIFDPTGFLSPVTMWAKTLMQILWSQGIQWDDTLPNELAEKWHIFVDETSLLSSIKIPRSFHFTTTCSLQLHGFSDASEVGYSAVLYFRCEFSTGEIITQLLKSKN